MHKRLIAVLFLSMLTGCAQHSPGLQPQLESGASVSAAEMSTTLAAADATRDEGNFAEALQIYQQLMVDAPAEPRAQFGVGECMLALGKPSQAKQIFSGLKSNAVLHATARQGEGLALLALGQNEPAGIALQEASAADPSLWRSWNALGKLADLRHQPEEATKFYAKASELNPQSAAVINNAGYSKLISGDAPHAIELLRRALTLDPRSETIQNNLRLAIAADGKYDDALKATSHEQLPVVLNNVGYVAMQRGDFTAAEGYFSRAMETSNSYASVAAKNLEQLKSEHPSAQ
jgi:Flp pilus assembly protein TadD